MEMLSEVSSNEKSICRMNNWNEQLENAINDQINMELNASHVYLAIYSYLNQDYVGFHEAAELAKKCSYEEKEHAEKFIKYQNIRGGTVKINSLEEPDIDIIKKDDEKSKLLKVFEFFLKLEQSVYQNILNISGSCNDPGLEDFLDDFIKEQLDSQYKLGVQIKQLHMIGNDGHGLYEFDKNLS